eukprot:Gb_24841 [translate_table: standard]
MGNCNCVRRLSKQAGVSNPTTITDPQQSSQANFTNMDVNQLDPFIEFIDHQLSSIKRKAPSTSGSTLLDPVKKHVNHESANGGIIFVSGFIEKFSKEVEELQKTGVTREMGSVTVEVSKVVGQSHWVLLGLSLVAFALERANQVSSNV